MTATGHLTDKEKNGNGSGLLLRLSAVLKENHNISIFIAANGNVNKVKSSLSKT
jgi:hypothetical protein